MPETPTHFALILLTLLSVVASWFGLRQLIKPATTARTHRRLILALTVGTLGLFLYEWVFVTKSWQPITAHVDGLLLIASLLAVTVSYLDSQPRMFALVAFLNPLLTLVLAWAVCAALWTYHPFATDTLEPAWRGLHLAGVYVGTVAAGVAATAGALYLYSERRIKAKLSLEELERSASLETIEALVVRGATLGFVLLTLGLVTGLILTLEQPDALGPRWYTSPKVILATLAWAAYAVVMNVRYATLFRGRRASWLAIGGFVLLLATYGIVTALDEYPGDPAEPAVALAGPLWRCVLCVS